MEILKSRLHLTYLKLKTLGCIIVIELITKTNNTNGPAAGDAEDIRAASHFPNRKYDTKSNSRSNDKAPQGEDFGGNFWRAFL